MGWEGSRCCRFTKCGGQASCHGLSLQACRHRIADCWRPKSTNCEVLLPIGATVRRAVLSHQEMSQPRLVARALSMNARKCCLLPKLRRVMRRSWCASSSDNFRMTNHRVYTKREKVPCDAPMRVWNSWQALNTHSAYNCQCISLGATVGGPLVVVVTGYPSPCLAPMRTTPIMLADHELRSRHSAT